MVGGGELPFLRWLQASDTGAEQVDISIGDDGAVVRIDGARIVVVADALAAGTHFDADAEPRSVGRKALAVNLSDLAAMGAAPVCAVATAALPRGFDLARAQEMTIGMRQLGAEFSCPLVGGDTVTHEGGVVVSVTALGRVSDGGAVTRRGARVGDLVLVTGALGGSRAGRHLTFTPRLAESRRLVELGPPSAMIDVSDGLLLDLARVCEASGALGFRLAAEQIPISDDACDLEDACTSGEDFELLVTAPRSVAERLTSGWDLETRLTKIGEITASGYMMTMDGEERAVEPRGYCHG